MALSIPIMSALTPRSFVGCVALIAAGLLSPQATQAAPLAFESTTALKPTLQGRVYEPSQKFAKSSQPAPVGSPQAVKSLEVGAQGLRSGDGVLAPLISQNPEDEAVMLQLEGALESSDPRLPDGSRYDSYEFAGEAGDVIQIRLESDTFDTYLILLDPQGNQLAFNDDAFAIITTNSLLILELPQTGRYQVVANSFDRTGQGVYQLTVKAASSQILAVQDTVAEIDRHFQAGFQLYGRSQYRDALSAWQQALDLTRSEPVRAAFPDESLAVEGVILGNVGLAYDDLGEYERAIALHHQSLDIARELENRFEESRALGNIGLSYISLSDYDQALNFLQQHLDSAQAIGDLDGEGRALNNLSLVYSALGDYEQAIHALEAYIDIARETGYRLGEGYALGNLGDIYNELGQYERAIELQRQYLAIAHELDHPFSKASALYGLGTSYYYLDQMDRVIDLFQQAIALLEEIDSPARATALGGLGFIYYELGDYDQAIALHQQHLAIAAAVNSRSDTAYALNNLGLAYGAVGDYDQAIELSQQSLALFRDLGERPQEGTALARLGRLLMEQDQIELAIVFLKSSVEVREGIRGNISSLGTELQQAFTDSVAEDYRLLADLLLQENRIIEAQRVLDLLKVQELDDYLQDVQRSAQASVDFWQPEENILALYDEVLVSGTELTQLQGRSPNSLSPDEQTRLAELTAQQNQLYTRFIDWLEHPEIIDSLDQLRADTRSRTVDIENFTDLQDQLAQLPQTTVILYPLILEDRLELVLVSADAPPVRYPVAVDAVTLNRTIVEFGQALKQPGSAVEGPAQQLYDWVIAPLESDLEALEAESIIFAPDGALRYVPLAALYDGEQWLIERFTLSQITAASETDFADAPSDRQALLAAACATCSFTVEVGDDTFAFEDLPATRQEVDTLATQIPESEVLVDGNFTPEQFVERLGSYNFIHLATHGMFVSGDPDASFLLFGDGQSVNLRQIRREWQQLDADLIVLSACETALGSAELGNGIEVLGLGFQLQRAGAKAVMASLWQVSDRGTQVLMSAFYGALSEGMTKAEALQAAQLALINSSEGPGDSGDRGIGVVGDGGATRAVNYSHPYYWAPFILIGNGL